MIGDQLGDESWGDAVDELPCWKQEHGGRGRVVISVVWNRHVGCGQHKVLKARLS